MEVDRARRLVLKARAPLARVVAVAASVLLTWQVSWLLTRSDNKAEIGAWSVIFTASFAIATVTRLGSESLALRSTAVDPAAGQQMVRATLQFVALLSVPGGVALAFLAYSRPGVRLLEERTEIAVALGAALIALNITALAGSWLRGLGFIASGAFLELGAAPILTFSYLGIFAQFELVDLAHVVTGYVVSAWLTAGGLLWWALAEFRKVAVPHRSAWSVSQLWLNYRSQLTAFMVTALGFFLFSYLSILVFGAFGDDASAADYRNCFTLAGLVGLVPTMQASYLTPRFADLFHRGQLDELQILVRRSTLVASLIGLFLALPLILLPGPVLGLVFGEPYVHAAPMLRILSVSSLLVVSLGPVYPLMTMTGLERPASRIVASAIAAGVVLMPVGFVTGGPIAVAVASVVPPLGFAVLGQVALRRVDIFSGLWRNRAQGPLSAG